ncbi:hypothetical protein [Microbacterium terregens]|uniref:Uncharacterized protein n=1 Tax=Microbacterium terregens TaxID=69363 RepID=A0ABV5SY54_9MICO
MLEAFTALASMALSSTATPTPEPTVDPALVTPGPWGFVVIALLAFAVVALIWDMMRRIRRGRVRADITAELDAEEQAADAVRATDVDDQDIDFGAPGEDATEGPSAPKPPQA